VTTVVRTGVWAAFVERRVIAAHIEPILIVTGAATALAVAQFVALQLLRLASS